MPTAQELMEKIRRDRAAKEQSTVVPVPASPSPEPVASIVDGIEKIFGGPQEPSKFAEVLARLSLDTSADLGKLIDMEPPKASSIATSEPVPLQGAEAMKIMIADLQRQMQIQSPGYESLLHTIHTMLIKDENICHMLTDEEIGAIVSGLAKKKNIIISENIGNSKKGKSLKNLSLNDI